MARILDLYCAFLKGVIALCLAVMVVLVFGNVVLRYGFNSGITISDELSRWLLVWLTFLGAIVAMREHAHLGVDTLIRKLPAIGKKICLAVGHVVMLYIVWLLFQGSTAQTRINWDVTAPVTGASMAIVGPCHARRWPSSAAAVPSAPRHRPRPSPRAQTAGNQRGW